MTGEEKGGKGYMDGSLNNKIIKTIINNITTNSKQQQTYRASPVLLDDGLYPSQNPQVKLIRVRDVERATHGVNDVTHQLVDVQL